MTFRMNAGKPVAAGTTREESLSASPLLTLRPCTFRVAFSSLVVCLVGLLPACNSHGPEVMARVNGHNILKVDVDKYFQNQTAGAEQQPVGEQADSLRLSILRELIDNEIIMRRAEKLGLLATDEEVDRKLNEVKSPFTQEQFDQRLKDKKITLDDFKRDIRRSLTVEKVINKEITSKVSVTDQDITNYYNAHKAEFNLVEAQYHLAQILVTGQPNPQVRNLKNDKAQSDAEAKKKVQMLSNRLDSGEDFASLAMNYSEDPETAGNGGDLGFTPESSLKNTDPVTRDLVMKLKVGQNSPVITVTNPQSKQVFGYRFVKLLAKEPAGQRDLGDPRVQQAIREQLRDRREQLLKAAYYEVLRDQAKVDNYYAQQVTEKAGNSTP
jgi:peptidyl-prolyl cis-trans isomerase SurA